MKNTRSQKSSNICLNLIALHQFVPLLFPLKRDFLLIFCNLNIRLKEKPLPSMNCQQFHQNLYSWKKSQHF